jgi:RNA polymerase sigma-70 factor (ECF subfamily)
VASRTDGDPLQPDAEQRDAFARLFAQHDRWLFGYLVSLLGNRSDAEEVFQEVCVVLWRECTTFQIGTNFVKWASVIAHNQVRKFRRSQRRHGPQLSDDLIDVLAAEAVEQVDKLELRRAALNGCLQKLGEPDRNLIRNCYSDVRSSIKTSAQRLGRPLNTVYKALNRIRKSLYECIERTLAAESR